MSARERLLDWMEAHYKDSHRLRRLDRTEAAEDILAIEAEAVRTALDALRERVEGLKPAPNLQGSPVNAYCTARDHALRLIDEARPK